MKVTHYADVRKKFASGDIVWACAFCRNKSDNGFLHHTKPLKGMLVPFNHLQKCQNDPNWKTYYPSYFIPFHQKKQGLDIEDLSWSKAVQISARHYATSEQECIEMYNEHIDSSTAYFQKLIQENESYKIQ